MTAARLAAMAAFLVLVSSVVFLASPGSAQNETDPVDGADDAEGNATAPPTDDERHRLPGPVLVAGAAVSLLVLVGVILLARRPRAPRP